MIVIIVEAEIRGRKVMSMMRKNGKGRQKTVVVVEVLGGDEGLSKVWM